MRFYNNRPAVIYIIETGLKSVTNIFLFVYYLKKEMKKVTSSQRKCVQEMRLVSERCGTIKKLCRYAHLIPNMIFPFLIMSAIYTVKIKLIADKLTKKSGVFCFVWLMINICARWISHDYHSMNFLKPQ